MAILAIDTVSAKPSIALAKKDRIFSAPLLAGRRQSAELLHTLQGFLGTHQATLSDLGMLLVLTGPGSFTGVRVGLSLFKGLSIGLDVPLYGVSHFDVLCAFLPASKGLILLESGRDEKFYSFTDGAPGNLSIEGIKAAFPNEWATAEFLYTDIEGADIDIATIDLKSSTAAMMLAAAKPGTKSDPGDIFALHPAPYYIREADTTMPKNN